MTIEVFPLWMLYKDFEVPLGSIVMWPTPTPPTAWLPCDGRAISRSIYKELWNELRESYGSGDGSTSFNIPNLSNTFIKGTAPAYDGNNYTWSGREFPGATEVEEFNHQIIGLTISGSAQISNYTTTTQYQVITSSTEAHSHSDAVNGDYRYTTIDNTDDDTASHDNKTDARSQTDGKIYAQRHMPGKAGGNGGQSREGVQNRYGTYYNADTGQAQRTVESFQYLSAWDHNHGQTTHTSSSASQGIIGGVDGTTLIDKSGSGQLASGTGTVGNHTHDATYSINRTHTHTVTGQSGSIVTTGLDSTIQPRYMPMLYIIYTGVA
jgi:microcystin-dependent protein